MNTIDCRPTCCDTPVAVNVPGVEGDPGSNGVNAYTTTTADFVIPAINANVTVLVVNSTWMVAGQTLSLPGPAHFSVVSFPNSASVVLKFLGYNGDVAAGGTIVSGSAVSPSGTQPSLTGLAASGANTDITSLAGLTTPLSVAQGGTAAITATAARASLGIGYTPLSVYAAGTAYQITATAAKVDFGTTDPALTISAAGTYLLLARLRIDYTGATFAAVRTVTIKLRRTNNTAADLTNSSAGFKTDIITTLTYTATHMTLQPIVYVTTASTDTLEMWASIDIVPTAGSIDVVEASIIAIKLFDQTL